MTKHSPSTLPMRARTLFAAFSMASMALAGGAWTACVGDSAVTASGTGSQNEPCADGGDCLAGLACVSGTCVIPATTASSGGTSSSGSSTSSGGIDDGGTEAAPDADAATVVECADLGDLDYPRCPVGAKLTTCSAAKPDCCPSGGCGTSAASCDPYNGLFECFGTPACRRGGSANVCCLTATLKDAGGSCSGAPNEITKQTATITHCLSACTTGELRLCEKPDGGRGSCPTGQTCALATLRFADGLAQVVPVCTKP